MSEKLHVNHYAEAERLLAIAVRHITEVPADMRISEVTAAAAQVHATLAAMPNQVVAVQEGTRELRAERETFRKVIVGHVYEAMTSPSREARKFAASITAELDRAGLDIGGDIEDRSESSGDGPFHYTIDGVVYRLLVQVVDDEGIAWEHTGDWTGLGEPVMGPANGWADRPAVHLPELVRTRGPLRPRKPDPALPPF